jgi:hypothetical protein
MLPGAPVLDERHYEHFYELLVIIDNDEVDAEAVLIPSS